VSRRAPSWLARGIGDAYTLHFWPPYGDPEVQQAKHYTGWARQGHLARRLVEHALGRGARLTQVQKQAGGSWVVADVEHGVTADREAQLKERGASRRCSVCQAQRAVEAGRMTIEEALAKSGWDRASAYERGLLLEIFGLQAAPPDLAALAPAPPEPEPFVPAPAVELASPERLAEMDALVDGLVAQWTAGPKGPQAEPEMELEAG
jgi:predicted GIY-YIG superfamily endonuclease